MLTFAGFLQTVRLLGGEAGASFIQFFLQRREQFHSNILGLHVQSGALETAQRALPLYAGLLPQSATTDTAAGRAITLLALTVRKQAFTLAIADSFQAHCIRRNRLSSRRRLHEHPAVAVQAGRANPCSVPVANRWRETKMCIYSGQIAS